MSASTLPLELLLQIFGHLDARSFFAARKTCRWWRLASLDPATLRKLMETLPILPPVIREKLSPRELQCLSIEASRALMLECSAHEEPVQDASLFFSPTGVPPIGLPVSFSTEAPRMAIFNGQEILLYDTSASERQLIAQRTLEERLGKGLWLKTCPLNSCKIALASHGHLLAIAFKSTIQVYDFSSDCGRCAVNDSVTLSNDQYITGLEFEQNDHLLRVHLSLKGSVVYLGSPPRVSTNTSKADFEHWSSLRGLQNRFLDSSNLTITAEGVSGRSWLSGVQALQPLRDGYLFAAQKHGGGQSSRYIVLHANCKYDPVIRAQRIDPSRTIEIARLESFLSSMDFGTAGLARHDIGIWEDMPSAHESCPKFCLTPEKTMLLVAEREKKRIWPSPMTQIFVYRLPTEKRIAALLERNGEERDTKALSRHTIPAIPLCLGTMKGLVKDVAIGRSAHRASSYRFTVLTDETSQSWRLDGV